MQTLGNDIVPGTQPGLKHLAIIMDGNGRWATRRGQPRIMGHQAGYEAMRRIIRCAPDFSIRYLTFYAFSTENWQRPLEEVNFLMSLPLWFFEHDLQELKSNGVRVIHSGRLDIVPAKTRSAIEQAVRETVANDILVVNLAFNYGGRAEIADAVRLLANKVAQGQLTPDDVDEEFLSRHLYQPTVPDPDLILRTSGEQRLSNFLLWQTAYSELFFTDTLWPDFDRAELARIIEEYGKRQRRYGGVG